MVNATVILDLEAFQCFLLAWLAELCNHVMHQKKQPMCARLRAPTASPSKTAIPYVACATSLKDVLRRYYVLLCPLCVLRRQFGVQEELLWTSTLQQHGSNHITSGFVFEPNVYIQSGTVVFPVERRTSQKHLHYYLEALRTAQVWLAVILVLAAAEWHRNINLRQRKTPVFEAHLDLTYLPIVWELCV